MSSSIYARSRALGRRLWSTWAYRRRRVGTTDADPHGIVRVDPAAITYATGSGLTSCERGRHFELIDRAAYTGIAEYGDVLRGEWDSKVVPIEDLSEWTLLYDRFARGVDWEDTRVYPACERRLENGRSVFGCATRAELHERFAYVDRLKESIEREGYRRTAAEPDGGTGTHRKGPPRLDEVTVDIGRDGELLYRTNGRHRLALAKILGVDEIPVLVKLRHAKWQAVRDAVRASDDASAVTFANHPDLEGVRDP